MLTKMKLAALLVGLLLGASGAAAAGDKTDIVILINGDHITGEIANLSRGLLELKTDHAGTLEIEWDKILSIQSPHQFTVTTATGRRLVGSLKRSIDRSVIVSGVEGEQVFTTLELTGIEPLGRSFWAQLQGSVGAGFNYTRSSGVTQFTLNTDTTYRKTSSVIYLTGATTLTGQSGDTDYGSVGNAQLMYERYRGRRWFVAAMGQAETNEGLGLKLRSQGGGLVGARLVNTNRAQFQAAGGISGNREQGVDVPATTNLEGVLAMRMSYYTYDRPKTNLDLTFSYYPGLSDWGRQRLQLNSSAKRELWKDFFVALSLYDSFDSAPPNSTALRNDIGLTTTISWSYGS